MKFLFVVAHPDDEMLGAGGLISKLCESRLNTVTVLYLTRKCPTRNEIDLADKAIGIYKELGFDINIISSDFDCLGIKFANHYNVVKEIENAIKFSEPDIVFTHHPADINPDHNEVAKACIEAVKLPIRKIPNGYDKSIKALYFMFVPSSTDWSMDVSMNEFKPDTFVEISKEDMNNKLAMLSQFEGVIREYPHPRSAMVLDAQLKVAGAKVGYELAEQFQTGFRSEL